MDQPVSFTGAYIRRVVDDEIDELFAHLPALALDGPKGVGKTATALQRSRTVRRLDFEAERELVEADPLIIGHDAPPILLDEWQRVPTVFDAVRRLVDDDPAPGRFLLTGSAPIAPTHSGAGRITTLRMRPLTLSERLGFTEGVSFADLLAGTAEPIGRSALALADYTQEIVAGGFPGLRHLSGRPLAAQLDGYLERIATHDLPVSGLQVRHPETVLRWLRAYAAATGTVTSLEKIRLAAMGEEGSSPARTTATPYLELLSALRIIDPVPAWLPSRNHLIVLTRSPKHHLADPALATRLVRLGSADLLQGRGPSSPVARDGSFLGALFESLVLLSVRTFAQRIGARTFHLRSQGGRHEIDLVVEGDHGVLGLEVKLSSSVVDDDVTHLRWLRESLGEECADVAVITTGPEAYRRRDGVAVIPLGLLVP